MRTTLLPTLLLAGLPGLALAHGEVPPPPELAYTFDTGIADWSALNGNVVVSHATDDDGNGYMLLTESAASASSGEVHLPAVNFALAGDYYDLLVDAGATELQISVDLLALSGDLHSHAVVQYHDTASGLWKSWRYDFDLHDHGGGDSHFDTFSTTFDPTWSDADAQAAGWYVAGTGLATPPWVAVWGEVYSVQIHFAGEGAEFLQGGVDNFYIGVAAAPVPEADTWALMLAGLGITGLMARRRARG
jgi:hypothetical protein